MHRIALARCGTVSAGKAHVLVKGWSVLSRPCVQRTLSSGPGNGEGAGDGADKEAPKGERASGTRPGIGAGAGGNQVPAGRGRGAFSQFLRLHERKIDQHIDAIERSAATPTEKTGRRGDAVSGQFDDPEEDSTGKTFGGTARDKDLMSDSKPASEPDEDWQEKWFSHEDRKYDDEGGEEVQGGDIQELDDDEEDDHIDLEEEYDEEVWKGYTEEQFNNFKTLGARLDREEKEQLADLRKRWEETKAAAVNEHGTFAHLELPDIRLTHEISYEAPPGKATAERAMPLPRALDTIVDSMELPPGLDVTPDDPEYEQVVNMWNAVSRNNSMDEKVKKSVIEQISTFIAKHRHSDAFEKALQTQDFPEKRRGKRPR